MSELLSSVTNGGGVFVASFASKTISIPLGSTGTITTLTPPAGGRVLLTGLASGGSLQTSLTTITINGIDIITGAKLDQVGSTVIASGVDELVIGYSFPNQQPIYGGINEVLEIKTNVSTSADTIYTYQFGA